MNSNLFCTDEDIALRAHLHESIVPEAAQQVASILQRYWRPRQPGTGGSRFAPRQIRSGLRARRVPEPRDRAVVGCDLIE